ncbi:hypothetical protein ACTD5D_40330 [Nocardia takedensis]|uniref:hypothetical protein n=1 Tax=Nocardia takedensis TaxID=259390 RepID=UPI003F764528
MTEIAATFYSLPAELTEVGMSTDDGQDVIAVEVIDGYVLFDVYTPYPDDSDEDENRRCSPEGRILPLGDRIELAVFPDTVIDGSLLAQAVISRRIPAPQHPASPKAAPEPGTA